MANVRTATINLQPRVSIPTVSLSQYDTGPLVNLVVYNGDVPADLAAYTATLNGTRPSGVAFTKAANISGNLVYLNIDTDVTREAGNIECEVTFKSGSTTVGSGNFILAVESAARGDSSLDPSTQALAEIAEQVHGDVVQSSYNAGAASNAADRARAAASSAESSALTSMTAARSSIRYAEAAVQAAASAQQITNDAEAYAAGTRNGTPVSSSDLAYHNNAKYYAEQLRDSSITSRQDVIDQKCLVLEGKVTSIEAWQAEKDARDAAQDASVTNLASQISGFDSRLTTLNSSNAEKDAAQDVSIGNLSTAVSGLASTLASLQSTNSEKDQQQDESIANLSSQISGFDSRLTALNATNAAKDAAQDVSIGNLAGRMATVEGKADANSVAIVELSPQVAGNAQLIDRISGRVNKNALDISTLDSKAINTDARVGNIEDWQGITDAIIDEVMASLAIKADDFKIGDDDRLYIYSGEKLLYVLGPFAAGGSGSGGGGGSATVNAEMNHRNTTGWNNKGFSKNDKVILSFWWESIEDGSPTGNGQLTIYNKRAQVSTRNIPQGEVSVDVTQYLSDGDNPVLLKISDVYGQERRLSYTVVVKSVTMSSQWDTSRPFSGPIMVIYTVTGSGHKLVYLELDDNEPVIVETDVSGRQQSYTFPEQEYGGHSLRMYAEIDVDGDTIRSNELYFEFTCVDALNDKAVITSPFSKTEVDQYDYITIPIRVYDPKNSTVEGRIYVNNTLAQTLTFDSTEQSYSFRADDTEGYTVRIEASDADPKEFSIDVVPSEIHATAETEGLLLFMSPSGRSNSEPANTRSVWMAGSSPVTFTNFNWRADGWCTDDDGVTVLRCLGGSQAVIPFYLFGTDPKQLGRTIELEFAAHSVTDYTSTIISCYDGSIGLVVTPERVTVRGEQSEVFIPYKDGENIRIAITIEPQTVDRLLSIYVNGILTAPKQYVSGERFTQNTPVGITIGSNGSGVDIYAIRVYDGCLGSQQLVENWAADRQAGSEMIEIVKRNDIYNEFGEITPETLKEDLPYFIITADEQPQYKGDKKACDIVYVNPNYPSLSFNTDGSAEEDKQGTSSSVYFAPNLDVKLKGGVVTSAGKADSIAIRPGSIPTNRFVLKADVASSGGVNNTVFSMKYGDDAPFKVEEQLENPKVRLGIEGIPACYFYQDRNGNMEFRGRVNYNLPKRCKKQMGYTDPDESWEIERNNSANVKFQTADFTTTARDESTGEEVPVWREDFEARFPDDTWTDITQLKTLADWLVSTNREACTNEDLVPSVTLTVPSLVTVNQYPDDHSFTVADVGGDKAITFTKDTPAYRLTKFRAEAGDYFELDSMLYDYLYKMVNLMIDSFAKNTFIGFHGGPCSVPGISRKAIFEPYDMDTVWGINNSGVFAFGYWLTDTDMVTSSISGGDTSETEKPVFNAQDSVIFSNVRDAFRPEYVSMYGTLRSTVWSYEQFYQALADHRRPWSEAIYNATEEYQHLKPLREAVTQDETGRLIKTDRYLTMVQGSQEMQEKWFGYFRFKFIDSMFHKGNALNSVVSFRAFHSGTLRITPAIWLYVSVTYGGGSTPRLAKAQPNQQVSISYDEGTAVNEMETWIGSADMLSAIEGLPEFYPNELEFSTATRLQRFVCGSNEQGYSNPNLRTFDIRNCTLMRYVDARNCPNLAITPDFSQMKLLREAYFEGTSITGIDLAVGARIQHLHLPGTIRSLDMDSLLELTDLQVASYANLRRLMVKDMPMSIIDPRVPLAQMSAGSLVNLDGINYEMQDTDEVQAFYDLLAPMGGVTRELYQGTYIYHEYAKAQVSGRIHLPSARGDKLAELHEQFPLVEIDPDHRECNLYYHSYAGEVEHTEVIQDSANGTWDGEPEYDGDGEYVSTFIGWTTHQYGTTVEANALNAITTDRHVYPVYTLVPIWTVTYKTYDGSETIDTEKVVNGQNATKTNSQARESTAQYSFTPNGWAIAANGSTNASAQTNITANKTLYAAYTSTVRTYNVSFVRATVDGGGTLYTQRNVPYGTTPVYGGSTPTTVLGTAEEGYEFDGWTPAISPVNGYNLSYTAKFASPYEWVTISKSLADIVNDVETGAYKTAYSKGNTIPLQVGNTADLQASIVGIDAYQDEYQNAIPLTLLITKVYTYNYNGRAQAAYPSAFGLDTVYNGLPEAVKANVPKMRQVVRLGGSNGSDTYPVTYNRAFSPTNTEMQEMIRRQEERVFDRTIYLNDSNYRGAQLAGSFTKSSFGATKYGWVLAPTGNITENSPYNDYRYGFLYGFNIATYEQVRTRANVTWEQVLASIQAGTYASNYALGDIIPLTLYGYEVGAEITAFDANGGHITFVTYRPIPGTVSGSSGTAKKESLEAYIASHKALPEELESAAVVSGTLYDGVDAPPSGRAKWNNAHTAKSSYLVAFSGNYGIYIDSNGSRTGESTVNVGNYALTFTL